MAVRTYISGQRRRIFTSAAYSNGASAYPLDVSEAHRAHNTNEEVFFSQRYRLPLAYDTLRNMWSHDIHNGHIT